MTRFPDAPRRTWTKEELPKASGVLDGAGEAVGDPNREAGEATTSDTAESTPSPCIAISVWRATLGCENRGRMVP